LDCAHSIGREKGDRCDESFVASSTEDVAGFSNVGGGKCHAFESRTNGTFEANANCARCASGAGRSPMSSCIYGRTIGGNRAVYCTAFLPIGKTKPEKRVTGAIHLTAEGMDECANIILEAMYEYPEKMAALTQYLGINIDDLKNRRDFKSKKGAVITEVRPA
jgi:hypothetical protein